MTTQHDQEAPESLNDSVQEKQRAAWTRWLALLGGNLCGLAANSDALGRALSHHPAPSGQSGGFQVATFLGGALLLPALVTGIAPRRSFLWGAVPLGLVFLWSLTDRIVAQNGPGFVHDFRDNGIVAFVFQMLVCGPISLTRLLLGRGREARAKRLSEYQVWQHGAAEAQAGVWPPPVRPDGYQARPDGDHSSR